MKLHSKKLIAPIIITCIMCLYLLVFVLICLFVEETPLMVKFVGILIPLLNIGIAIYVLIERIKEIKGGEEDDLSKY